MCYACNNTNDTMEYKGRELCGECVDILKQNTCKILDILIIEECMEEMA